MNQPAPESAIPDRSARFSEDWLAIILGLALVFISGLCVVTTDSVSPEEYSRLLKDKKAAPTKDEVKSTKKAVDGALKKSNPLSHWISKPDKWGANPLAAFEGKTQGIVGAGVLLCLTFLVGVFARKESLRNFVLAFPVVFALAIAAELLSSQEHIKYLNLEYALWALVLGLLISNTIKLPEFLKPAVRTEFYIKTGLVLFGAEVLFGRLLALGLPGVFVAWVVTPIVLVGTYLFGQYVLKIESKSLNMVISADMSVCGVSAAIATAASCKAKKEELSTAISISLMFTVIMMVVMPYVIKAVGMNEIVGGAWIGGTVDSSGAVLAAGEMVSKQAGEVAATVKMIQNILIGVISFAVAAYWVTYVERTPDSPRPGLGEIWKRFPKFILGFVGASIICSVIYSNGMDGRLLVDSLTFATGGLRGWCFCLAFVSIGLETNFAELSKTLKGGKPLLLYVCGQSFNLLLTFLMAWLMYTKVFPQAASNPLP